MSGECDRCDEHCIDCRCNSNKKYTDTVQIHLKHLLEIIYWARRYCDNRSTYAPSNFNKMYDAIVHLNPFVKEQDQFDTTLKEGGKYWPYAQDGMYDEKNDRFDARPLKPRLIECKQCGSYCVKNKSEICIWCALQNIDEKDASDGN